MGRRPGRRTRLPPPPPVPRAPAPGSTPTPRVARGGAGRRVAGIGGGAWGTALGDLLARTGAFDTVTLWAPQPQVGDSINREHPKPVVLPGAPLAPRPLAPGGP